MHDTEPIKFGTFRNQSYADGAMAFNTLLRKFDRTAACHPGELSESFYIFGGKQVRLRIVGRELAKYIVLPISHLRIQGQSRVPVQLTIDIWDGNGTIDNDSLLSHGNVECYETILKSPDGRFIGQRLPYTVSCLDRQSRHIVASIAWNKKISNYERAKPLARLLLEWHNDQNIQIVHAALVARKGQGVLVAGKRGAGKSTVSLACIRAGLDFVSEDFVGLERRSDDSFVGHSLYNSVFLETVSLARFEDLIVHAIESEFSPEEKSAVILSALFSERLQRAVPIRVLALPRVVDSVTAKFRPASKSEALLGLGPSSFLQIPNRERGVGGFDNLAKLVERVPCYWLEVGSQLPSIGPSVEGLLDEIAPAAVSNTYIRERVQGDF